MKKLMVAFAAIAMAACAQAASTAASTYWAFQWATDKNATNLKSGTPAYFVNVTDYSLALATSDLAAGKFDASKATIASATGYTSDVGAYVSVDQATSLDVGSMQTFYTVIINTGLDGAYDYLITDTMTTSIMSLGRTEYNWGEMSDSSTYVSKYDWSTYTPGPGPGPEPVPEPTSAMLLMLGAAGLALKRKRA